MVKDSATMFTEFEFNNFLLKRKIDPIWKTVQYFQSTMRIKVFKHYVNRIHCNIERNACLNKDLLCI